MSGIAIFPDGQAVNLQECNFLGAKMDCETVDLVFVGLTLTVKMEESSTCINTIMRTLTSLNDAEMMREDALHEEECVKNFVKELEDEFDVDEEEF